MKTVFAVALAIAAAAPATATVTAYSNLAAFQAATSTAHLATFEGLSYGYAANPLVTAGLSFTALTGNSGNYVTPPNGLTSATQTNSASLAANGDENFAIAQADGASFTSIGMDYVTNRYGPPSLSLYRPDSSLIGTFAITVGASQVGFFGLVSTEAVGFCAVDRRSRLYRG